MALGVFDPGEAIADRRGGELRRIRRAEHLLKRKRLLCVKGPGSEEEHESPCRAGPDSHARMLAAGTAANGRKDVRVRRGVTSEKLPGIRQKSGQEPQGAPVRLQGSLVWVLVVIVVVVMIAPVVIAVLVPSARTVH